MLLNCTWRNWDWEKKIIGWIKRANKLYNLHLGWGSLLFSQKTVVFDYLSTEKPARLRGPNHGFQYIFIVNFKSDTLFLPSAHIVLSLRMTYDFIPYINLRCNMKITDWEKFTLYYLMSMNKWSLSILINKDLSRRHDLFLVSIVSMTSFLFLMTFISAALSQAATNTAGLFMQGPGSLKINAMREQSRWHPVSSLTRKRKERV